MEGVSGVVIAGGKAQRMQGLEKGLVLFQQKPMISWVIDAMSSVCDQVVVNANGHIEEFTKLGYQVISDDKRYENRGPLAGLWQALVTCHSSHLLVSPCDTPRVSSQLFQSLIDVAIKAPDLIHCVRSESGLHPIHAILPVKKALASLEAFLEENSGNSVMRFYKRVGYQELDWAYEDELLNVNYLAQLEAD